MAATRVMERVSGVNIVPHFCRIEDKELDFYSDFNIIVLGLDSIEARSYINAVACSFLGADCGQYNFKKRICFIIWIYSQKKLVFPSLVILQSCYFDNH